MLKNAVAVMAAAALAFAPAIAGAPLPNKVGDCVTTSVKSIGTRLDGIADSGSAIEYANGLYQVSYDIIPEIAESKAGDPVTLCLTELPQDCPPGDDRGKIYKATNLRTHRIWVAPDSEHSCGGA